MPSLDATHMRDSENSMTPGQDYIGVGVGALIFDENDKVFLAQRGPEARNERGTWEFPGGSVSYGETLEEAIVREIDEEYGMRIRVGELLDVIDHLLPEEGQHWVSPTFVAKHVSGEARILEPHKCTGIGWFTLDTLPAPLSVVSAQNVKNYVKRHSKVGLAGHGLS
jgi:8-oxo-dGTP diphosphatase